MQRINTFLANFVPKIKKSLQMMLLLIFGLTIISITQVNVVAQEYSCTVDSPTNIKIWNLPNVSSFLPLIPENCALDSNGEVRPLTLAVVPDLIYRGIGFLFSLAFYLVPLWVILLGFITMVISFAKRFNVDEPSTIFGSGKLGQYFQTPERFITEKIFEMLLGLILVVVSYAVIFTLLQIMGLESTANTNVSDFFTF